MTELWSEAVVRDAERARQIAYALSDLTRRFYPVTHTTDGTQDSWPTMGWALLARAHGTLESIMALLARRRAADAAALHRVLFEHVLTLAWVAIDPAEHPRRWLRWDRKQRLKADRDLVDLGADRLLETEVRAAFEAEVRAGPSMPDSIIERAIEADRHWSQHTHVIQASPTEPRSFRQMYRAIFRYDSRLVHPTVGSIETFVHHQRGQSRTDVWLFEHSLDRMTSPFSRSVHIYALALLLAEPIFSLPPMEPILDDLFSSVPARLASDG